MSGANSTSMRVASDDDLGLYRSLSAFAVLSLILGLLSILSFAPTKLFLWVMPPAAIVTGLVALRQISSAPDVWTGRRLAQLGIGLAVVCAAGSVGERYYTSERIARHGKIMADRYVDKLKNGDIEAAFWLTVAREQRKTIEGKSINELPAQVLERYASFRAEAEPHTATLAERGVSFEFEGVEKAATDHSSEYASLVYRLHTPHGDSRVLIVAVSVLSPETHEPTWMIREHKFDYKSGTYEPPVASGHGHSH